MGSGEAMSSERLAEWRKRFAEPHNSFDVDKWESIAIIRALLAEVERLRAHERPLLVLLRAVASGEPLPEAFMWQARGWLQAEEEAEA